MNSGKGMTHRRSWVYHPLEFGVSGDRSSGREQLAFHLARALGPRVGVLNAHERVDPDEGAWTMLDDRAVLVDAPVPGLVLPRLHVLGPRLSRAPLSAGRGAPPVAVAGPSPKPRRLPWGVPWFDRDDVQALADFVQGYWDSQVANRPLYGLVLAGGRGEVMGRDKANLTYGGKTQIERTFELLAPLCAQTWVSCRKDQSETKSRASWPQIHDRYVDRGPLGGILSALDHRPDAAWLVVACDHPYLDEATLGDLLARRDPLAYATSFQGTDSLPEPLCTVYEPKSRLGLLRTWALGYACPRKLLSSPASLMLEPRWPQALVDVNTPRDHEEAQKRLGA